MNLSLAFVFFVIVFPSCAATVDTVYFVCAKYLLGVLVSTSIFILHHNVYRNVCGYFSRFFVIYSH